MNGTQPVRDLGGEVLRDMSSSEGEDHLEEGRHRHRLHLDNRYNRGAAQPDIHGDRADVPRHIPPAGVLRHESRPQPRDDLPALHRSVHLPRASVHHGRLLLTRVHSFMECRGTGGSR